MRTAYFPKKMHLLEKKIVRSQTGQLLPTACGAVEKAGLASFVLSCGRAAERGIATSWELVTK